MNNTSVQKVANIRLVKQSRRTMITIITGLDSKGKKEELLKLILESSALRDLKDTGFRVPTYIECKPSDRPTCYPEIYEGAESATALRNKAMNSLKAPTA